MANKNFNPQIRKMFDNGSGKPKSKSEKNKPQDKKMERRTKAIEPIKKPKKNTIKDKLNKVGNMKVKDAAKVVGKVILAGTPVGAAKNVTDTFKKNFKFQSPIVSRKNRKFGGK